MPSISWPAAFPALSEQYSFEPQNAVLRTEMESGFIRQRQRFTVDAKIFTVSWDFDDLIVRRFEAWFRGYLAMGSGWFTMPLAVGGGLTNQQVRFVGGYSCRRANGFIQSAESTDAVAFWQVSAKLEVIDSVGMSTDLLSLILSPDFLAAFDSGLEATADLVYHQVHVELPASILPFP